MAGYEPVGLLQEPATIAMLEIEDRVELPVEDVGESGRLRVQRPRRRPAHSPRRPSSISVRSTSNGSAQWGHVTVPTDSPLVFSRS